jgi:hypothetical protein
MHTKEKGRAGGDRATLTQNSERTYANRKPWPPYSKIISPIMGAAWGLSPDGLHYPFWVLFGPGAWGKARQWRQSMRRFVLLPPGDAPSAYGWGVLRGHPPVLLLPCGAVTGEEVKALVVALLRDGVERVLYLGAKDLTLFSSAKGVRHAA